jgi:hypothetical protein
VPSLKLVPLNLTDDEQRTLTGWARRSGGAGFAERRLQGLTDEPRPGRPRAVSDEEPEPTPSVIALWLGHKGPPGSPAQAEQAKARLAEWLEPRNGSCRSASWPSFASVVKAVNGALRDAVEPQKSAGLGRSFKGYDAHPGRPAVQVQHVGDVRDLGISISVGDLDHTTITIGDRSLVVGVAADLPGCSSERQPLAWDSLSVLQSVIEVVHKKTWDY